MHNANKATALLITISRRKESLVAFPETGLRKVDFDYLFVTRLGVWPAVRLSCL